MNICHRMLREELALHALETQFRGRTVTTAAFPGLWIGPPRQSTISYVTLRGGVDIVASLLFSPLINAGKAVGYLIISTQRTLYSSIKEKAHGRRLIRAGVPQGSSLSLLLYWAYQTTYRDRRLASNSRYSQTIPRFIPK
ncbi:hypothetical protein EVAR_60860_1 [Eumeta japonica]|uniref:Uncharacterized protein n=1 Tax=Eumeta variegata TaxID=151549 RepID=A0A4C1Y8Q3_EUMVA|nr:hypothetical protein EVAR_60860_1 [Eumeta japonica]